MSTLTLSLTSIGGILLLIGLRVPIGVAMGTVAFLGFWYLRNVKVALSALSDTPFVFAANWELSAIPMFLLMGAIAGNSGIGTALLSRRLCVVRRPARRARGRDQLGLRGLRRGVRLEHRGRRHDGEARRARDAQASLRQGACDRHRCASGGTLDALIPPSILFVLYGVFAEVSIAKLLIAGIIPGLLTADRLHDHDHAALLARSFARAAGRIPRPRRIVARALGLARRDLADHRADRRCDRRALCRRGDADRGRRGGRVPRDGDRLPAPPAQRRWPARQLQRRHRHLGAAVLRRHRRGAVHAVSSRSPAPPTCSPSWSAHGRSIHCCW